jgi:hypothetical protein
MGDLGGIVAKPSRYEPQATAWLQVKKANLRDARSLLRSGDVVIDDIGLALPLPWRYDVDGFRVYSPF